MQENSFPTSQAYDNEEATAKRRRIALACSACRRRKSRCDGARPKCSACRELNFDCVYVQSGSARNIIVGREYLSTLEMRLEDVEKEIGLFKKQGYRAERSVQGHDESDHGEEEIPVGSFSNSATITSVPIPTLLNDTTDGIGSIAFTSEEDFAFFGPSSNISFTRHITKFVARISSTTQARSTPETQGSILLDGGIINVPRVSSPKLGLHLGEKDDAQRRGFLYELPPESQALDLIHQYFSNTGMLFPYIHKATFLITYQEMKSSNFRKVRRTWLGLLNMVFAMAISATIHKNWNAQRRAEISGVYFQRASGLCDEEMRGSSLETVQTLLLMVQYLQGSQKSIQTWTIHGIAVKSAFQLGLHSTEALNRFPPLEREIRKRTWFGCVVLDRTLSMTFGRPSTIPDSYVRVELPSAIDNEDHEMDGDQSLKFFKATIELYKVMWKVIDSLYGSNLGCDVNLTGSENFSRLLDLDMQLAHWKRTLAVEMSLVTSESLSHLSDNDEFQHRYRVIITLRYHNLRILTHRPILVKFMDLAGKATEDDQQYELSLLQQIGPNSVNVCVQSATQIISLIKIGAQHPGKPLLGAWWFSLYYVFNAALVIFSILLSSQAAKESFLPITTGISRQSLTDAIDALHHLDDGNRMIQKCRDYLRHLGYIMDALALDLDSTNSENVVGTYNPNLGLINVEEGGTAFGMARGGEWENMSPLGMNMGEFILDRDVEFLSQFMNPRDGQAIA